MRRVLAFGCVLLLLLMGGCSFRVQKDTIYIPQGKVESIEFQKQFEDGYHKKTVVSEKEIEEICAKIRKIPAQKAGNGEPHPITERPMVIILHGAKDHTLILAKDAMFYDEIAYKYTDTTVYGQFESLYKELKISEEIVKK
jgi:hypothetical protein